MNVCLFICPLCVPKSFIRLRLSFGKLLFARLGRFLKYKNRSSAYGALQRMPDTSLYTIKHDAFSWK